MKIEFKRISEERLVEILGYFRACKLHLSDFSCAHKFMWQKHYTLASAVVENCVVFAERYLGKIYYHYPMSLGGNVEEETRALDALESFTREEGERLHYTNVPREKLDIMIDRYGSDLKIINARRWRDYLYSAQDFKTYAGKKFSGQRNHVNKFKRLYPEFKFITLTAGDSQRIIDFLNVYGERQLSKGTTMAKEELDAVYSLVPNIDSFDLLAAGIEVEGKLVALSIGERCGDMLIIHVEKALSEYEGAYPAMAQQFAIHFASEDIKYINREDDAGDAGLRKSKMQYNPVKLVDKFNLYPHRLIDGVAHLPVLQGERIVLKEIPDANALEFYRLEYDGERNKYWGYSWREHYSGEPTPEYFLQSLRQDFKEKEELPLGIFLGKHLIGEAVLHNFGYRRDCEAGVRLLPEYEGKGYASEAVRLICDYALYELDADVVYAKCFKQNERSKKCLLSAGLRECVGDEIYYRFFRTAAM